MARFQRGWLRTEDRKAGRTWVLRFYASNAVGRRVERTMAIGLVNAFPTEASAWQEINRLRIHDAINQPDYAGPATFGQLAAHYREHELGDQTEAVDPKSHTTIAGYTHNLDKHILPKWGDLPALTIEPRDVETWLKRVKKEKGLANPTLDRLRRLMSLIYKSAQRYGLIPRSQECNPMKFVRCKTTSDYEARTITPRQAHDIWKWLEEPEKTLTLLAAATGLRISECLGLQWADVDFANQLIHVRRTWTAGKVGLPKSKASKAAVPLHPQLALHLEGWHRETAYGGPQNWVFPSEKLKGTQPRVANMLVSSYLRPAAIAAGVIGKDEEVRFGFHTLRHSLATFLVATGKDPKTVQSLLRHSDVTTTLNIYSHAVNAERMTAQGDLLAAFFPENFSGTVQ
jgi:integrase